MTCCIGYKTDKVIYFISDTQGSNDDTKEIRLDPKIFKLKDMLFATCGSFRMRDVLMYDFDIPKIKKDEDVDKYIRTTVIDNIRNLFIEKGICIKNEETDLANPGDILIGIRNRIYKIESDFQVGEINKSYVAIGCGAREAMGAMTMFEKYSNLPESKNEIVSFLKNTIETVAELNVSVNNICNIISKRIN